MNTKCSCGKCCKCGKCYGAEAVEGRDVAFFLGDGLCAEECVGAADIDGVADGDFAVGDSNKREIIG